MRDTKQKGIGIRTHKEISQDNLSYDLKGIEKWDDEMDAMVMWAAADQTVHAYHAIRGEACLDSGANLNIFQLENEPHMSDMVNSDMAMAELAEDAVLPSRVPWHRSVLLHGPREHHGRRRSPLRPRHPGR